MGRKCEPKLTSRERLSHEVEAVKQVVAELPQVLQDVRKSRHRRRRRLFVFSFLGLAVVAGGAVAFSIARRSAAPEPSPLPPSVDVAPKI